MSAQTNQGIDVVVAYNKLPGCDDIFAHYDTSAWWWGAFGNCKTGPGGTTDRSDIFDCAWAQVPAGDQTPCLKEKLFLTAQTSQGIDAVAAYNAPFTCDQLFAHYNTSAWWWGAFGNCKTGPGGITDRSAIFECAWAQVNPSDQTTCLRESLRQTIQTSQGIDAVAAYNAPLSCDQLFASYDTSSWWWGAFGNCMTGPGGTTDRSAIFECAWAQVQPSDRVDCLKEKLLQTSQTREGIDAVVAYNYMPLSSSWPGGGWYGGTVQSPPAGKPPATPEPCKGQTSNGLRTTFYFDVYCGRDFLHTLPAEACTRPEALKIANTLLNYGCYAKEIEGNPKPYEPPKPEPACKQQVYKFCVACDGKGAEAPTYSQPSVNACTKEEASDNVKATRPSFCDVKLSDTCP